MNWVELLIILALGIGLFLCLIKLMKDYKKQEEIKNSKLEEEIENSKLEEEIELNKLYEAKNNADKKELEIYFEGRKIKSFHNPKNNLFVSSRVGLWEKVYIDVYAFEAYKVIARGYCSNSVGHNIEILKDNHQLKKSIKDNEIIQNNEVRGGGYWLSGSTLYFGGEDIKDFEMTENMRIVSIETSDDGVLFELREYLEYKKISHLECSKNGVVETCY